MNITYLSLGTNLGDKLENIKTAIQLLAEKVGNLLAISSVYETEPVDFESKEKFLNAAVKIETELTPYELLKTTQRIELMMGRTNKTVGGKYSDRIIDIDILLFNNQKINTPELTIPHPRMKERAFVMQPLQEIIK